MKYKLTFALVASLTSTAFAAFQAPLPEFKNEKQLAEWRAEKASETSSQGYVTEEAAFYTGKPYLPSSGDYAFKYRSYNPEMARWTSEDPSGFPDGANNRLYISGKATYALDADGLKIVSTADFYTLIVQGVWQQTVGGDSKAVAFLAFKNTNLATYAPGKAETHGQKTGFKAIDLQNPKLLEDWKNIVSVEFDQTSSTLGVVSATFTATVKSTHYFLYE
jgi:RHS repeat-associated protein